jgi:BMFP domain-containing protein YqiC
MQTDNRLFDDIARAANGALGALSGVRNEIEAQLRGFLERWLKSQDLVTREEFEVVKAMASKAREENEELRARIAELEAKLAKAARAREENEALAAKVAALEAALAAGQRRPGD